MRFLKLIATLAATLVAADSEFDLSSGVKIYIQPVGSQVAPVISLAEVRYDASSLSAEIESYESPDLSSTSDLVRLGVYDPISKSWKSSTTVTSAESFTQGFTPTFILSLDGKGDVLSVTCKSGRVDAGQTRDFGPKVKVVKTSKGRQPELNRPVVVSKEGTVEGEEPEKTLLQRFWWVGLAAVLLVATTGGDK